jgi:RNA polymerase-binding transcription factor DksA
MPKATGRASAPRKTTKATTPVKKKAAPPKKAAPKKPVAARKPAAKKPAAPATKAQAKKAQAKKAAPAKKAPAKKVAPIKKPAPVAKKAAAPVKKSAPEKAAPVAKKAPAPVKAAPAKVPTVPKSLGPVQATYPTKRPVVARKGPVVLDKFLIGQQEALNEERLTYIHQAETLQAEADELAAEREPGDVQFDEESGEGDTLAVERERDLALSFQARVAVDEIDAALAKILEGSYGVCEQCGSTIPKERLRAIPYAALCVQCKSMGLGRR